MFNLLAFQAAYALDIACALILIIWAFIGAKKGFVKCFFGLVSTLIALVLAITLASTVSGWLNSAFGMTGFFSGKFENTFLKINGFDADISSVGIASALENVNLPGFLKDLILKNLGEVNNLPAGTTLASQVAPVAAQFVGLLISGLVIFIVARLLLLIVEKILSSIVRSWSVAAALNGILGFVVGALKALIVICAVLALLSLIPSDGLVSFFDKTIVLKYLFNENPLTKLLGLFIKF